MKEYMTLFKNAILYTLGNIFVYHVMFPLIFVAWKITETPEEIPVDEQAN